MKFFWTVLFFVVARLSCAQSQSGSDVLASAIANLPPCALNCTISTIDASSCELTDLACIIGNEKLLADLTTCVKASCMVKEALTAKRFLQELLRAPFRDKTQVGTHTCLIMGVIAVLVYLLRVVARLPMLGGQWGLDDWAMTASMLFIIPLTICAFLLNELGLGKDMWYVPFDNITKILEIFYFTELLYLTAIALTKISILLFYLRIFPHKGLRRAIYVTIVLCVLYIIGFVTATALQCIPVKQAWLRWDGEHHGKCTNLNAIAWLSAGVNIVLDLFVIILPMGEIKKLSMSRRRRFGVMLMFLVGGFVTIVSMLRLKYMVQFAHTENVTWDYLPVGIWSAVETHVGVIVACMPAMRSLEGSLRNRFFPRTQTSTTFSEESTRNNSRKKSYPSGKGMLSTFTRSTVGKPDKEEFMRLDGYELRGKSALDDRAATSTPSENSVTRSFGSNEDQLPLATAPAMGGLPLSAIMVQTEYSVDRGSQKAGKGYAHSPPRHADPLSPAVGKSTKGDHLWQAHVSSSK
ncbi:hypothetical protein DPSP01_000826 [Paraphaeosphaeria sporulosa]